MLGSNLDSGRTGFTGSCLALCTLLVAVFTLCPLVLADPCPEEDPLQNYTGGGTVVCPCFVAGEEAGAVLQAPAEHYPIEILRVGIGWGSMYGGTGQTLEQAIHIYAAGLPNPGSPIFTLEGPALYDGYVNEFDLEPLPGEITIDSGPFTVTLEFMNDNAGDPYAPSMVHDGNGCQAGKNVVYAIPGGWYSACALGVTGDWVVYAIYRQVNCGAGIDGEMVVSNRSAVLLEPEPNPFSGQTRLEFVLGGTQQATLSVYDVTGRTVATLLDGEFGPGNHTATWSGTGDDGAPLASGIYFAEVRTGSARSVKRVVLSR
jgi:hypothetical protein